MHRLFAGQNTISRYIFLYYTNSTSIKLVASIKIFGIFFTIFFASFFFPYTPHIVAIYSIIFTCIYVLPLRALGDRIRMQNFRLKNTRTYANHSNTYTHIIRINYFDDPFGIYHERVLTCIISFHCLYIVRGYKLYIK